MASRGRLWPAMADHGQPRLAMLRPRPATVGSQSLLEGWRSLTAGAGLLAWAVLLVAAHWDLGLAYMTPPKNMFQAAHTIYYVRIVFA